MGEKTGKGDDDDSDDYEKNLEINWNHVWREEYEKELDEYNRVNK